jgi:hypothetical protein
MYEQEQDGDVYISTLREYKLVRIDPQPSSL